MWMKSTPGPATPVVRVLVVDDQQRVRRAARAVIEATAGFEAVDDASSGPEALARMEALRPDLVLMDVRMPEMDGLESARRMTMSHPDSVVVLVSAEDLGGEDVTTCGASAFVRKQELSPTTLTRLWAATGPKRRR
jgi:two-component system invasion response regulator UvrY